MSTSYRQARNDDSSDDEGPLKRVKHNNEDEDDEGPIRQQQQPPAGNKKVSRNVWADVVQEEELTIRGNVMDMNDYKKKGGTFVKINRGAETYTVPAAQLEENAAALEAHKNSEEAMPVAPPTSSDDPFGDTADLGEVEAFGVGPSSGRHHGGHHNRGGGGWQPRGRPVRGSWIPRSQRPVVEAGEDTEMTAEGEDAAAAASGGGHRGGRGGGGGRGGWRGAPRGFVPRGRGGHWGGGDDRKRRWNDEHHAHAHAKDPAELMDDTYSLAGLLATEFQEGLTPRELGEAIAKALGEKTSDTVVKIAEAVGEAKALELFEETKKAEQAGGVKVADGSRRRTPGGVFILLFKSDADVDPSVKGSIFEDSKQAARKIAKAKYRKNKKTQDVKQGLDELQQLLDERKKALEKEEGEATPSPEAAEGQEQLDYTEEESPEGTEEME